ncbi:hypothetical protein GALMADRAFT_148949 [Galerina marginata CBS 339.88]|uniref:Uncharacterized protein n=1 Tax=Galerina marginata (strain CBS 339.88) TaxID=685588 RepID=A0A067S5I5_GALM3|nr:hypothetical protein GALMADRAFT_148949 [Galerina marginata CBS 339.88]
MFKLSSRRHQPTPTVRPLLSTNTTTSLTSPLPLHAPNFYQLPPPIPNPPTDGVF